MSAVTGQFLLVSGALLLVFANVALGDGTYQRTKNGRTLVWNNRPKPGDEATWSGGRDGEGYARGFGTLIWYTKESRFARPALYARYWGNMVQGKLNGPVNVHSKKKTHHAIFADGARTTRWVTGTAPSRAGVEKRAAIARQSPSRTGEIGLEPPAQGPSRPGGAAQPSERWPEPGIDDSLQLLVWPPRSLRVRSAGTKSAPPFANARLTKEEVVDIADAVARSRGYDLADYQRPEPQYDPADQTWSLLYDQKPIDGTADIGKHFSVAVSDKTKRTVLVTSK